MRARIERADHPACVSVEHLGELRDGAPSDAPDRVGAFERHHRHELPDGRNRLEIELAEVPRQYVETMNQMWPQALARLLQIFREAT